MHWHKWRAAQVNVGEWEVKCSCGNNMRNTIPFSEKQVREICWKSNVHSGNLKANYINNGVLKAEKSNGIILS